MGSDVAVDAATVAAAAAAVADVSNVSDLEVDSDALTSTEHESGQLILPARAPAPVACHRAL